MKLIPQGERLLVEPLNVENHVTEGGIELINQTLETAKVVEVSEEFYNVYKKGDTVILPREAGISQMYNGKSCKWVNGKGHPQGDIFAIVTED